MTTHRTVERPDTAVLRDRPALPTPLDLFTASARKHPDATAVTDDDRSLTFGEADEQSTRVAAGLAERGVAVGTTVGICLARTVDLYVALLAVLKCRAAYVPIDDRYPVDRQALMLDLAHVAVVIDDGSFGGRHPDAVTTTVADLASAAGATAAERVPGEQDDVAAILFTSGTTGRPKPVALDNGNLSAFAANPELPALTGADRVAQISSISFDAFHFEMWCSVAAGARLVMLDRLADLVLGDIRRTLRRARISSLLVPATALNNIVREDRSTFDSVRVLFTGGDVVSPRACATLLDGGFRGTLVNLYGPTECATAVLCHTVRPEDTRGASVPIGRPFAWTTPHILDENLAPVPDGEAGELFVAGAQVARGYYRDPDRTAERFVPDVVTGDGAPMYRTGDLVRRRPDGEVEFVGRVDAQVKIRGFRVEPAEVQRVLVEHERVDEGLVVARGEQDDRHLAALFASVDPPSISEIRSYLAERLPEFMVPASIRTVPRFPITANGKVDHAALDELLSATPATEETGQAHEAASPTERAVTAVWEDLLSTSPIALDSDFFVVGGNSLLAFRMQRRLERECEVALRPEDILTKRTIRELAGLVDAQRVDAQKEEQ